MISVLVSLFLTLRNTARSRAALQLEVLALRHQLQVLERSRRCRPRLSRADRLLWGGVSHAWPDWRTAELSPPTFCTFPRKLSRRWTLPFVLDELSGEW